MNGNDVGKLGKILIPQPLEVALANHHTNGETIFCSVNFFAL